MTISRQQFTRECNKNIYLDLNHTISRDGKTALKNKNTSSTLRNMDKNKDGVLTKKDFDVNKDGKLSTKELSSLFKHIDSFDNNGDSKGFKNVGQSQKVMTAVTGTITKQDILKQFQQQCVSPQHERIVALKETLTKKQFSQLRRLLGHGQSSNQVVNTSELYRFLESIDKNGKYGTLANKGPVRKVLSALKEAQLTSRKSSKLNDVLQAFGKKERAVDDKSKLEANVLKKELKQEKASLDKLIDKYVDSSTSFDKEKKETCKNLFKSIGFGPFNLYDLFEGNNPFDPKKPITERLKEFSDIFFKVKDHITNPAFKRLITKGASGALVKTAGKVASLESYYYVAKMAYQDYKHGKTSSALMKKMDSHAGNVVKLKERLGNLASKSMKEKSKQVQNEVNILQKMFPKEHKEASMLLPKYLVKQYGLHGKMKFEENKNYYIGRYILKKFREGQSTLTVKKELGL